MKNFGNIDSKFRFVILASKRAKSLLRGAKPRVQTKFKNLVRIAQMEMKMGLVDYEILKPLREEPVELEDKVSLGDDIVGEVEEFEEEEREERKGKSLPEIEEEPKDAQDEEPEDEEEQAGDLEVLEEAEIGEDKEDE